MPDVPFGLLVVVRLVPAVVAIHLTAGRTLDQFGIANTQSQLHSSGVYFYSAYLREIIIERNVVQFDLGVDVVAGNVMSAFPGLLSALILNARVGVSELEQFLMKLASD